MPSVSCHIADVAILSNQIGPARGIGRRFIRSAWHRSITIIHVYVDDDDDDDDDDGDAGDDDGDE